MSSSQSSLIQPGDLHHLDSCAVPQNQPLITPGDPEVFANILETGTKPHLSLQANEKKIKVLLKRTSKKGEGIRMGGWLSVNIPPSEIMLKSQAYCKLRETLFSTGN